MLLTSEEIVTIGQAAVMRRMRFGTGTGVHAPSRVSLSEMQFFAVSRRVPTSQKVTNCFNYPEKFQTAACDRIPLRRLHRCVKSV